MRMSLKFFFFHIKREEKEKLKWMRERKKEMQKKKIERKEKEISLRGKKDSKSYLLAAAPTIYHFNLFEK